MLQERFLEAWPLDVYKRQVLVGEVIKVTRNGDNILDMCTGSGCIGITLAKKFPRCV